MFEFVVRRGKIAVVAGGARRGRRSLAAVVLAAALAVAAPGALASAQTRIGVNGGRPTEWPILSDILASQGLTKQGWLDFGLRVGENWLPDTKGKSVALDYPGQLGLVSGPGALTTDQSTKLGQKLLHQLILNELDKGEPVAVAGISEGTLVNNMTGTARINVSNGSKLSTALASEGANCAITVVNNSKGPQVKPGSLWATFSCPALIHDPGDGCSAKGTFVLENCSQ
jgi:hypothetical protein